MRILFHERMKRGEEGLYKLAGPSAESHGE